MNLKQYFVIYKQQQYTHHMTDIHNFKEETFALIRQQTTTIKTLTKDMEIKDQQIKFLKDTICSLEEEKDTYLEKYNEGKMKMQAMIRQISTFNENVVHKLYNENDTLRSRIEEMERDMSTSCQSLKKVTEQAKKSQERSTVLQQKLQKISQQLQNTSKEKQKIELGLKKTTKQSNENEDRVIKLQVLAEQLQNKNKSSEKQIQSLLSKCQQLTTTYERKIKSLMQGTVDKGIVSRQEQELKKNLKLIEQYKGDMCKIGREKQQAKLQMKLNKQKSISTQTKMKIQEGLLESDLRNILQSFKLGKKVTQFESKYSQLFYEIYEEYFNAISHKQELFDNVEMLSQHNEQLQRKVYKMKNSIQERDQQNQVLREKMKNEIDMIQCSYEGKIIQLSIKIQKEQKTMHELQNKNKQFEQLKSQYQKVVEEQIELKQFSDNTIRQYKKQNEKLMTQVQQLVSLCDQTINTKNSLNYLKRILHDLLSIIHYLYAHVLFKKQTIKSLYYPFICSYYSQQRKNNNKHIRKFRVGVWMVIAIQRMKKNARKTQKGITHYSSSALQQRLKINNANDYMEKLMEKALGQKNAVELVKFGKAVYKWPTKQLKQITLNKN